MASVKVHVHSQELYDKLLTFIKDNSLQFEILENTLLVSVESEDMNVLKRPTEHFKEFCGAEWLTPKGLISKKSALDFIHVHIQTRKVPVKNGILFPNEWLQKLLMDSRSSFYLSELPQLVDRLFI